MAKYFTVDQIKMSPPHYKHCLGECIAWPRDLCFSRTTTTTLQHHTVSYLRQSVLHCVGIVQQLQSRTGTLLVANLQLTELVFPIPLHKCCNNLHTHKRQESTNKIRSLLCSTTNRLIDYLRKPVVVMLESHLMMGTCSATNRLLQNNYWFTPTYLGNGYQAGY